METSERTSARALVKRHAVLAFYILVLALAFGTLLIGVGPGVLLGTTDFLGGNAEPTSPADLDPVMYVVMLTGAPSYALVAVLVIALAFGRAGLRDLRSRLLRWRVGARWYAVALLTYPLVWTAILFTLSLTSGTPFVPDIITAEDKASLLVAGLVAGLVAAFFEEIAWTGFATHELRKRHGLLATGLIVGLPWALLHVPLFAGTNSAGLVPQAVYLAVMLSWLPPYRVLMVWVYGRTQSVLMAMLMHLPITAGGWLLASSAMVAEGYTI